MRVEYDTKAKDNRRTIRGHRDFPDTPTGRAAAQGYHDYLALIGCRPTIEGNAYGQP